MREPAYLERLDRETERNWRQGLEDDERRSQQDADAFARALNEGGAKPEGGNMATRTYKVAALIERAEKLRDEAQAEHDLAVEARVKIVKDLADALSDDPSDLTERTGVEELLSRRVRNAIDEGLPKLRFQTIQTLDGVIADLGMYGSETIELAASVDRDGYSNGSDSHIRKALNITV